MDFIHYLESISGISIYPLLSLLVFFIFFVVLTYLVLKMDKEGVDFLKRMPLNDQETSTSELSTKNEIE